jgi:hypothetical protein
MNFAREDDRTLIPADTDFGELIARSGARAPSVILLRRQGNRRASELAEIILANLDEVADSIDEGAIVVFDQTRTRVRRLPLDPPSPASMARATVAITSTWAITASPVISRVASAYTPLH